MSPWSALVEKWGLASLGVVYVMEGMGIPIPVEIPFVLSSAMVKAGRYPIALVVLLTWLTTVVGNVAGYTFGYLGGRPLVMRLLHLFRVSPARLEQAERWFGRYGVRLVFLTRWINWGFGQSLWLTGIARVPMRRFLPWMIVNDLLWAAAWVYLGGFLAGIITRLHMADAIGIAIALVVVITGGWFYLRARLRNA